LKAVEKSDETNKATKRMATLDFFAILWRHVVFGEEPPFIPSIFFVLIFAYGTTLLVWLFWCISCCICCSDRVRRKLCAFTFLLLLASLLLTALFTDKLNGGAARAEHMISKTVKIVKIVAMKDDDD
jgi:hypothetical protein